MVRPLTKRTSTGELYCRPSDVEHHIDVALAQDVATIQWRLAIVDQKSPDHLKSECLVHMLREALQRNDSAQINMLLPVLLSRCEKIIRSKVLYTEYSNVMDLQEEILSRFAELFIADGTADTCGDLDYFECRFHRAFRTYRIDIVNKETKQLQRTVPLPTHDQLDESGSGDGITAYVREVLKIPATQEEEVFLDERRSVLWSAIRELPWDERKVIILHEILDYDVESENPDKETVATLCDVTGKTVRNRLKRAKSRLLESLQKLKEES